jgi:hypothetical protein
MRNIVSKYGGYSLENINIHDVKKQSVQSVIYYIHFTQ